MSDVLIVGGGPAGCAAGRLLALWGHQVKIVTRAPSGHSPSLAESLPPSCGKLFDVLGIARAVEEAGFIRSTGNTVWWGDAPARAELFAAGERGWQVTADRLAALLLDAARTAGVTVQHRRVSIDEVTSSPESIVLDCTGRGGLIARARSWRRYEPALKTVALAGLWSIAGRWPVEDDTHTVISAGCRRTPVCHGDGGSSHVTTRR
jgi:2-polyprenyl-6-methoxyphenol hydroxylase-like FAD-dependent oxidoreductase